MSEWVRNMHSQRSGSGPIKIFCKSWKLVAIFQIMFYCIAMSKIKEWQWTLNSRHHSGNVCKNIFFQYQYKYRSCNKAKCGGSTSICTSTGSTYRTCKEGGEFDNLSYNNTLLEFETCLSCQIHYALHANCQGHFWQNTFWPIFHSCQLLVEKLGLLGQLQQNMWRRGEIYSFTRLSSILSTASSLQNTNIK